MRRAIQPLPFIQRLAAHSVDAFFGVPDSLLKDVNAAILDASPPGRHVVAANEGAAVAMAAGYHLASSAFGCVYLQNSGLGNALNPLLSLTHPRVYGIPVLLLVGWRGDPTAPIDEPQHIAQGGQTEDLLRASQLPYDIIDGSTTPAELECILDKAEASMRGARTPHVLLARRGTFEGYESRSTKFSDSSALTRVEAIEAVLDGLDDDVVVVGTTGMISREIDDVRRRREDPPRRDFLMVGSMGHAVSLGLGLAVGAPTRTVVVIDGDGSSLMHMGSLPVAASRGLPNLHHVVLNNGAHDSVGGQPTIALNSPAATDGWMSRAAEAFGYRVPTPPIDSAGAVKEAVRKMRTSPTSAFLEIVVAKGHRPGLGRPQGTPADKREAFMALLAK